MEYREENNYPKAFLATGIVITVVIALCYFIVFSNPPKLEGTGGILVNYGTTDAGSGTDYMSIAEPSKSEKANHVKPDKITPTPTEQKTQAQNSDKKIVTQTTEDAPEVANNKKASNTIATQPTKTPTKEVVNTNALYKGKTNNATGEGDGTTTTPGNQGKPTGSTLTNNYNGTGSGNGGNLNLSQRSFVSRPSVSDDRRHTGRIIVDIYVDKSGNVIYARAGARGTTISDSNLLQRCEDAVKNSKLNPLDSAPDPQVGTVVFVFKVD